MPLHHGIGDRAAGSDAPVAMSNSTRSCRRARLTARRHRLQPRSRAHDRFHRVTDRLLAFSQIRSVVVDDIRSTPSSDAPTARRREVAFVPGPFASGRRTWRPHVTSPLVGLGSHSYLRDARPRSPPFLRCGSGNHAYGRRTGRMKTTRIVGLAVLVAEAVWRRTWSPPSWREPDGPTCSGTTSAPRGRSSPRMSSKRGAADHAGRVSARCGHPCPNEATSTTPSGRRRPRFALDLPPSQPRRQP
jgi:hypothetical protein